MSYNSKYKGAEVEELLNAIGSLKDEIYGNGGKIETLITNVNKTDGQYYSLNSRSFVSNSGYFTSIINLPQSVTSVKMRFEKSAGGIGVEFMDEFGERTGFFSNTTQARGTKIKIDVPHGTFSMVYSYLNDLGLSYENVTGASFDGIVFFTTNGLKNRLELLETVVMWQ